MKKLTWLGLIALMLILSLCFLNWSGILKFSPSWASSSRFPHLKTLTLNRQGNAQLKAQNYAAAFDTYIRTLEFDPFAPETHLDLGLTYEGQQATDKALPSYQNALKYAQSDGMKFMALFNQAQLLGKEKKIDEALELYQKALAFDPTSKETKTNIELLIQMQQQQQKNDQNKDQENKDQKDNKDNKDQKDKKDNKDNKDDKKDNKDQKDDKDQKDKDKKDDKDQKDKKNQQPQQYGQNQKYKPRPFNGKELSEGDVKKILGEIKQQEQKIRSEYNRKDVKEQPRDKDW